MSDAQTALPDEPAVDSDAEEIPGAPEEATEPGMSLELAAGARAGGAIIRAEQPDEVVAKAVQIANALKNLIEAQGLAVNVGGKRKHVEVGGWQALGAMLGALGGQPLHAETSYTRRVADPVTGELQVIRYTVKETKYPQGKGAGKPVIEREYEVEGHDWEARVEIKTAAGVVVGAAEAMCSRTESTWSQRPEPAVRAMAETRAESRAYRRAVGWIVNIAGYNPTPAEEMPAPPEVVMPNLSEAADGKAQGQAADALAVLLDTGDGPDNALALQVLKAIVEDPKGASYVPRSVVRAFLFAAAALRKADSADAEPESADAPSAV